MHNSGDIESAGFVSRTIIDDIEALAPAIKHDADSFPRATEWHIAAGLVARAVMVPDEIFPLQRSEFVYVARQSPHGVVNVGVLYHAHDKTMARADSVTPERDNFTITNFTVGLWTDRLQAFRRLHNFPPLEQ